MSKELCFRIEHNDLFLNQVLVDYNNIPIFFLCQGKYKNYLSLCVDIENYNYVIVEVSLFDIYDLLHGNVSMRDAILNHKEYWMVTSGEDISNDIVERKMIKDIDQSWLPQEGAYFKVLTESIEQYLKSIDNIISIQENYITYSELKKGYKNEIKNTIDMIFDYSISMNFTNTVGQYDDWINITIERKTVLVSNDESDIYQDNAMAA